MRKTNDHVAKAAGRVPGPGGANRLDRGGILILRSADCLQHLEASLASQWKRYRKALKSCQKKFSEDSVHQSRVATRRLLALVELLRAFLAAGRTRKLHRALKQRLDIFDDLRDTQVQLLAVHKLRRRFPAARSFSLFLAKREKRATTDAREQIRRTRTRRLGKWIAASRADLQQAENRGVPRNPASHLLHALELAYAQVAALRAAVDPRDTSTIHRTRVAFKKFRYMREAMGELLPGVGPRQLAAMRRYQTLMGDIQDAEVCLAGLDIFLQKKKVSADSARALRQELMLRRKKMIKLYLASASKLDDFRPL